MAARPGLIRPETNIFDSSALRECLSLHHADCHSGVSTPFFSIPWMRKILVKDCSSPPLRSRPLTKEIGSEWSNLVYADTPKLRRSTDFSSAGAGFADQMVACSVIRLNY
jgi:hypothetical protein